MFTHAQPFQPDRADGDAGQRHDLVAEPGHHPADLAVLPLGEDHLHDARLPFATDHLHALGANLPLGEPDPLRELVKHLARRLASDDDPVDLFDPEPGMSQSIGELAIVRQEHQARALLVEPPDRVDPLGDLGEQIDDLRFAGRVAVGADVAFRLMHGVIDVPLFMDLLAVNGDLMRSGVHPRAEFADDLIVHRDSALEDQFLAAPTRADPRVGEDFLQAFRPVWNPLQRSGGRAARAVPRGWAGNRGRRGLADGSPPGLRAIRRAAGLRTPTAGTAGFAASTRRASFSGWRFLSHDDQSLLHKPAERKYPPAKPALRAQVKWTRAAPLRGDSIIRCGPRFCQA